MGLMMGEWKERRKVRGCLACARRGSCFFLGDSGAMIGDWDLQYALVNANKKAPDGGKR